MSYYERDIFSVCFRRADRFAGLNLAINFPGEHIIVAYFYTHRCVVNGHKAFLLKSICCLYRADLLEREVCLFIIIEVSPSHSRKRISVPPAYRVRAYILYESYGRYGRVDNSDHLSFKITQILSRACRLPVA